MKGLAIFFTLSLYASSFASTRHVPADYPSIQAAVLAASHGDTVLVAPGLYEESIALGGRSLILLSEDGAGSTTIRLPLGGASPVVSLSPGSDATTVIDGFTIQGRDLVRCISSTGSSPKVQNCIIEHGYENRDGGGAFFENGAPVVRDNVVRYNHTDISGGGIFVRLGTGYGTARVERNRCYGNSAGNGPGIAMMQGEGGVIAYNVVYGNTTVLPSERRGAVFVWADSVEVLNNTIDGNSLGLTILSSKVVRVRNNIISHQPFGGLELQEDVGANLDVTHDYNDLWSNGSSNYLNTAAAPHELSVDPLFLDAAHGHLELLPGSACVDAGDPAPLFNDPDGSRCDLGALPLGATHYPVAGSIGVSPSSSGVVTSLWPTFAWSYVDTAAVSQTAYEVEVGEDADWTTAELWTSGTVASATGTALYAGLPLLDHHTYQLRVRVKGSGEWGDWRSADFTTHVSGGGHVPGEYATIQGALDGSVTGDTIWVAPGLYEESINFAGKTVVLLSEAGADQTTIRVPPHGEAPVIRLPEGSGDGTKISGFTLQGGDRVRCIEGFGVSPTISDCVIENGYVYRDGGGIFFEHGAPVIENNIIRHNTTRITGGGLFLRRGYGHGKARVVGNTLYENTAPNGPAIGMIQGEGGTIERNVVFANSTILPSICRGAIYVWANDVTVWNNTLDGNTLGLTVMSAQHVDVRNNIISQNPLGGYELRTDVGGNADITAGFNDVWNNDGGNYLGTSAAGGDLSSDPLFLAESAGDLELRSGSVCIDAGDPAASFHDLDGSRNDLGALPYDPAGLPRAAGISLEPGDGIDVATSALPTVHWSYYNATGAPQSGFELEVGAEFDWTHAELWATGQVTSTITAVPYAGTPLQEGVRYYLRLRVSDGTHWGDWREKSFLVQSHVCGNGVLESGEACDDGNLVAGDGCNQQCDIELMVCGNGHVEPGEDCDDGNLLAGDGCDPVCQNEPGLCGNGVLEYGEHCDDGNLVSGDGCDQYCDAEPAVCGNGVLEVGEACDDGNLIAGDGCNSSCQSEGEATIHFAVTTGTGGDTLIAGVPGSIVFSVHAPENQAVSAFAFPIRYTFSQANLIGPVSESGGGAYVQFSPKAIAAFEVRPWNHQHGAAATNPDTTLLGLLDLNMGPWTGSGELWRLNFVPTDTGTIVIDSLTVPPGVSLEAVDPAAVNLAFEWTGATIVVVPGYSTGDTNADQIISSADVITLVNHTFKGGAGPAGCDAKGDVNCSGVITASDIIKLVNFVFKAGSPLCNAGGIIRNGVWECP